MDLNKDFVALGGSLDNPSADTVVKAGRVPSADYITTIFEFLPSGSGTFRVTPHPNPFSW